VTFDVKPVRMPRRDIAIVLLDYAKALLPWRTAAGNVSLALEASHVVSSRRLPACSPP
jgi:NitT/TauT family transport system ATP-binding protein